ncbi:hypothetical protein BDD12DRAFT_821601 [Trichophaea hybrida]|nr:hypothetical protein BDD12DRAFT_821601 [Trichophaea hybrida]
MQKPHTQTPYVFFPMITLNHQNKKTQDNTQTHTHKQSQKSTNVNMACTPVIAEKNPNGQREKNSPCKMQKQKHTK